jgi:GNAT superfamily N-acetyltransferase
VWVAERGGTVLGVVSVHLTPLFHAAGFQGRVTSLVVRADARGHGIGGMLMRQAEAFCWAAGCARVELTSGDHRAEAHRFYEGLGYHVRSRRYVKDRPGPEG